MARNSEDMGADSTNLINEALHHFCEVEKREGTVSPLNAGQIRLEGLEVTNFSSQYGSEASISYVAINLAGQLSVFPKYGDYTQACVLRTYGPWWKKAPSGTKPYNSTPSDFTSEDFLEIRFREHLYPIRIEIYETYNPGAVVRILACDEAGGSDADRGKITWATLWSQGQPKPTKQRPRIFAPPVKKVNFATNLIRLELNSTCLDYYTELDGVKLVGTLKPPADEIYKNLPNLCFADESWEKHDENKLHPQGETEGERYLPSDVDVLQQKLGDMDINTSEASEPEDTFFAFLPRELLQLVLSYLDIRDLCKLAQTCRLLRDNCYDPLLYVNLNLQPFWAQISGPHLLSLVSRCERVQRLNLSWLGGGGHIDQALFKSFLACVKGVTTLELSCCNFVNSSCLMGIVETCTSLRELNLSGCTNIDNFSIFNMLPLRNLKRLNLYRTKIDGHSLIAIIKANPDLEHLNIGSCVGILSRANHVLAELGNSCKNLKSLDIWRLKNINEEGLTCIYNNCLQLEELDAGWSTTLASETGCFVNLAKKCRQLKKIFLTANRSVRDCDLKALADHCPHLQQLDILGTRAVTLEAIIYFLEKCTSLTFLDVSFCVGITHSYTCDLRAAYPHVDIKRSFQDISSS